MTDALSVGGTPKPRGDVDADGTVRNRYVHLLGFCPAFIVPYVALELGVFEAEASR